MEISSKTEIAEWELLHLQMKKEIMDNIFYSVGEKRIYWQKELTEFEEREKRIMGKVQEILN